MTTAERSAIAPSNTTDVGMQVYDTTTLSIWYWNGTIWTDTNANDKTNDAFVNNATNTRVELNTNADGTTARTTGTEFVIKDDGKVGIGTTSPNSTLTVNGSAGFNTRQITNSTYNITNTDFYIAYEGSANGVFTLPIGTSSTCNCEGRTYEIYNNSDFDLTINAQAGETIGTQSSVSVAKNQTLKLVNRNTAGGRTWDVVVFATVTQPPTNWQLVDNGVVSKTGFTPPLIILSTNSGSPQNITGSDITFTVPSGYAQNQVKIDWTLWGDLRPSDAGYGSFRMHYNYTGESSGSSNFVAMTSWATTNGTNWIRFITPISTILTNLAPGTYTITISVNREDETIFLTNNPQIYNYTGVAQVFVK